MPKLSRRSFIQSGASASLGAMLPTLETQTSAVVGGVSGHVSLLGFDDAALARLKLYSTLSAAVAALRSGEIQAMVSTPALWGRMCPEFIVFDSLAGLGSGSLAESWARSNYHRVNEFYKLMGLRGEILGSTSASRVRVSRISPEKLASRPDRKDIRLAAAGGRTAWFEQMGFQVITGDIKDRLSYQLEMVLRNELDVTDAFYPHLFLAHYEKNQRSRLKDHRLLADSVTRGPIIVEMLFADSLNVSNTSLGLVRSRLRADLAAAQSQQSNSLDKLQQQFGLSDFSELPQKLISEISACNKNYVQAAALTPDHYGLAHSLRSNLA